MERILGVRRTHPQENQTPFGHFQNKSFLKHQNRKGRSSSVSNQNTFRKTNIKKKGKKKRGHKAKSSAAPSFRTQSKRRTGLRPFKAAERANSSSQDLRNPQEETNGRNPNRVLETLFRGLFIIRIRFGSQVGCRIRIARPDKSHLYPSRKYLQIDPSKFRKMHP